MAKILRKAQGPDSKIKCFCWPQFVKVKLLKIASKFECAKYYKENINHISQFISVEVKKNLRKSQAHFRGQSRKLRLWQNYGFLITKRVCGTCAKVYL